MGFSPLIDELIERLRVLPGVGPKSAQRMALYLIERNREGARRLAAALLNVVDNVGQCNQCRTLSEEDVCRTCANPNRDRSLLCVVENPSEVFAIEQAIGFKGLYFVLHGRLSPIDGIGPEELGLRYLAQRFDTGEIAEVVLATNPTIEGEATAQYIAEMAKLRRITATRIAHGIPMGGELDNIDSGTLSYAFSGRRVL